MCSYQYSERTQVRFTFIFIEKYGLAISFKVHKNVVPKHWYLKAATSKPLIEFVLFLKTYFKRKSFRMSSFRVVLQISEEQQIYRMSSSWVITSFAGPCTFLQFSWKLKHTLQTELDKCKSAEKNIRPNEGLLKNADIHLKHLNLLVYRLSWLLCKNSSLCTLILAK